MTRIIAGEFGGRRIAVPPKGTRPTSDRVREAMFSRLDHEDVLRDARVLDLYAGSGALGIEALSRGAVHATLVESAVPAVRAITTNVKELGLGARGTVVKDQSLRFLERRVGASPGAEGEWDLVFLDPPYDIAPKDLSAVLAALAPSLASHATVVVEWTTRQGAPDWPSGLEHELTKKYGDTTVHYARRVG